MTDRDADVMLWRSAQRVLERHRVHLSRIGTARCAFCLESWPCPSALEAARATRLAGGPVADLSEYATTWLIADDERP